MFASPANRSARRARRIRLGLEELAARAVPAVLLAQVDLDGDGTADDIRITGDLGNNKVTVHDDGQGVVQITIDANGDGDSADGGDLAQMYNFTGNSFVLEANLGGGNDSITYLADANMNGGARSVVTNLGTGNDAFIWDMNSHNVGAQSRIALDVTAGYGADNVDLTFAAVSASTVSVRSELGAGIDTYDLVFGLIDQKASVDIDTDLGAGPNAHAADFQGIGKFDQAVMDMSIVGGNQKDTVDVRLHDDVGGGQLSSRANVSVDLLGGDDVFQALLDSGGGAFRVDDHSQASISVRGGAGNDNLQVNRGVGNNTLMIDPDGLCEISLFGGLGNDTVGVNFGGTNAWWIQGALRVRLDGGYGNDILNCLLSNSSQTTGTYDVAVRGGAGNDNVTFGLVNGGGTPTYGPAGGVILDGGIGVDTLTNANPQVSLKTAFETVV